MWTYRVDPEADTGVRRNVASALVALGDLDQPLPSSLRLGPDDDWRSLLPLLANLKVIAIEFADFTDGRGFSIARLLRDAGFGGELRATGDILVDQVQYLNRCGFDAFDLPDSVSPELVATALAGISVRYQAA